MRVHRWGCWVLIAERERRISSGNAWLRASALALLALAACGARQGSVKTAQASRMVIEAEVAALKKALVERDRTLNQLENRLALLEAEQRQLRYAVAEAAPPVGIRETVRIGAEDANQPERAPPTFEAEPERQRSDNRPVLRLVGEPTRERANEPMMPIPVVSERLPLAPLPEAMPSAGQAAALDPRSHYRQAIDLVRQRAFGAALASLTDFLVRHPSDGRAPKVMFWRGEVLFAQREYTSALEAFESSLAREPKGAKAADALLKVGLCHKRLGAPERARDAMERLKAQFPQSDAARLAAQEDA